MEEYIEVLKRSLTEAEKKALSSQSGEKKEVTSKSAAELERVVNAMKRVIGRFCKPKLFFNMFCTFDVLS